MSPLPEHPDSIYDYQIGVATSNRTGWMDGRVAINGVQQQDAFTDSELVNTPTPTPTATPAPCSVTSSQPPCGSIVTGPAPNAFIINLSDPAEPVTVQGSDFTVNGTPAILAILSNGNTTITFAFTSSPVTQGPNTMHISAGAFNCANGPVQEFTCMFTYKPSTPTPTPTQPPPTATPTATVTPTPTAQPTPTGRPDVTPRTRPTPPPRP